MGSFYLLNLKCCFLYIIDEVEGFQSVGQNARQKQIKIYLNGNFLYACALLI